MGKARMLLVMARAAPKTMVVEKRMMACSVVDGMGELPRRDWGRTLTGEGNEISTKYDNCLANEGRTSLGL